MEQIQISSGQMSAMKASPYTMHHTHCEANNLLYDALVIVKLFYTYYCFSIKNLLCVFFLYFEMNFKE